MSGKYARFLRGGGGSNLFFGNFGCTCREKQSCEPLLEWFGGIPPPQKKNKIIQYFKWCNFVRFEGYF